MNLNKVILVGRLTKDPVLKQTPSGQSVASFSVATNQVWTDKAGQKQESSEFHNIVVWGKTAELAHTYLTKGQEVLVEGRLQTRSWDDKQGVKHYMTEVIADRLQFGSKPSGKSKPPARRSPADVDEPIDPGPGLPTIDIREEEGDLPY